MRLVAILQTDCPTCRLIAPYLNALAAGSVPVTGFRRTVKRLRASSCARWKSRFPVERDPGFEISKKFGVVTVPTLYVLDEQDRVVRAEPGFDKNALNEIAAMLGQMPVASAV